MAREHKGTKTHTGAHRRSKAAKRADEDRNPGVPGAPPTDNVRKHPDEVYGDTEIPQRGARLDRIKRESR
jgi:hypothetical protein